MFKAQIQRVKENILPFIFIGLFVGVVIGKASWFRSFSWVNDYLNYAGIDTRYPDSGQALFFNHFGPATLTFLLVAMFAFSGFYRIALGVREKGPKDVKGFNQSLESIGSLLAIAWLGLILGIMLPTLIFQGFASFITFFVNVSYPLVFLVEVNIGAAFLAGNTLKKVNELAGGYHREMLAIRAEGIVLLSLSIIMMTYQQKHLDTIKSFTVWIKSML